MTVTPIRPIIPPSLQFSFLLFRTANRSSQSSSDRYIQYRDDLWIARRRTGIVEAPTGRHGAFLSMSSREGMLFDGFPVSVVKVLLKQPAAIRS